jgi:hypothetical protein
MVYAKLAYIGVLIIIVALFYLHNRRKHGAEEVPAFLYGVMVGYLIAVCMRILGKIP